MEIQASKFSDVWQDVNLSEKSDLLFRFSSTDLYAEFFSLPMKNWVICRTDYAYLGNATILISNAKHATPVNM